MSKKVKETEWGVIGRLWTDSTSITISGFDPDVVEERLDLYQVLLEEENLPIVEETDVVPVDVACRGKATLATYLFVVHGKSVPDVAEQLDVSTTTVEQYLSDFMNERRR